MTIPSGSSTFKKSKSLLSASLEVAKRYPALAILPIIGAMLSMVVAVLFALPVLASAASSITGGTIHITGLNAPKMVGGFVYLFLASVIMTFVSQFFQAAVVHGAYSRLVDQRPTIVQSLKWTSTKVTALAPWALISAVASALIGRGRQSGTLSRLLGGAADVVWKTATFVVLPILVVEGPGPIQAYHRSRELMTGQYGMTATASFGFKLVGGLAYAASAGLFSLGVRTGGAGLVLAALGAIAFVVTSTALSVLQGVYRSVFYYYAVSGQAPPGFAADELEHAFA